LFCDSDNTIGSSTATMPLNQQNQNPHPSTHRRLHV